MIIVCFFPQIIINLYEMRYVILYISYILHLIHLIFIQILHHQGMLICVENNAKKQCDMRIVHNKGGKYEENDIRVEEKSR